MTTLKSVLFMQDRSDFFVCRQLPRLVFQHHRDAVPDGIGQPVYLAYQFIFILVINKRPLANRASQYIQ